MSIILKCEHLNTEEKLFTYIGKRVWIDIYCPDCNRNIYLEQRLYKKRWWKSKGNDPIEKLHNSGEYTLEPMVSFIDTINTFGQ